MKPNFDELGEQARKALGHAPEAAARKRLAFETAQRTLARRQVRRRALAAGVVFALVSAGTVGWLVERSAQVAVTIDDRPLAANEWVERPTSSHLRFAEHSEVVLSPDSRLRLVSAKRHDMHLILEAGRLEAAITPGGTWQFEAGPYVVHVIGTQFSVDWKARQLEVGVTHGVVEVTGGSLSQRRVSVSAGEHLRVDGSGFSVEPLAQKPAQAVVEPMPAAAPAPEIETDVEAPTAPAAPRPAIGVHPKTPSKSTISVSSLLRADDRAAAFGLLEREGLERAMQSASGADWLLLCDAARLERRTDLAVRVCEGLRARFSASTEAADAAFRLGRIAFDAERWRDAARWFHAVYAERPTHPLSTDALGREMEALARAGAADEARARATLLLQQDPASPWAPRARSLVK